MRTILVASILLVCILSSSYGQLLNQRTPQGRQGFIKDQGYFSAYVTLLGAGYNSWVYNFEDEAGNQDFLSARGQGLVLGPHIIAAYTFNRLSFGVEGGYDFMFMRDMDDPFIPDNIQNLENTQRHLIKVAGKIMYDVFPGRNFSLHPNIAAGTFWFTRDDFDEDAQNRFYGKVGALFDLPLTQYITFFAEPHYAIFNYRAENLENSPSTSMNVFHLNVGLSLRL